MYSKVPTSQRSHQELRRKCYLTCGDKPGLKGWNVRKEGLRNSSYNCFLIAFSSVNMRIDFLEIYTVKTRTFRRAFSFQISTAHARCRYCLRVSFSRFSSNRIYFGANQRPKITTVRSPRTVRIVPDNNRNARLPRGLQLKALSWADLNIWRKKLSVLRCVFYIVQQFHHENSKTGQMKGSMDTFIFKIEIYD